MSFIKKNKIYILKIILALVITLFFYLTFKNIQYPLFWNDEGDTAIFGKQILQYGYPKIHGVKNVIYHFNGVFNNLAVKKSQDAYINANWGQYYFVTPFLIVADMFKNPYTKTLIIRLPFAMFAFSGILIFGFFISSLQKNKVNIILFSIIFFIIESTSISLLLEIRQARAYPVLIFLSSAVFLLYLKSGLNGRIGGIKYVFLLAGLLVLLFLFYYPLYFIFIITFIVHEIYSKVKNTFTFNNLVKGLVSNRTIVSIVVSFLVVVPLFFYFEIPKITFALDRYYHPGLFGYVWNVIFSVAFFSLFDYFIALLILWYHLFKHRKRIINLNAYSVANYLFLFIVVYILTISKSPYIFSRFYVGLQPVISATLVLMLFLFFQLNQIKKQLFSPVMIILGTFLFFGFIFNCYYMKNYLYEITHQYKGVLDYVVPYIQANYKKPQDLVIATNYEEQVLMYYLDSRVIVGYAGFNIEEDLKLEPDIIIPRKKTTGGNYLKEIQYLIDRGGYKKTTFEIFDYPVNNIQELFKNPTHLFYTKLTSDPKDALEIYEKNKN